MPHSGQTNVTARTCQVPLCLVRNGAEPRRQHGVRHREERRRPDDQRRLRHGGLQRRQREAVGGQPLQRPANGAACCVAVSPARTTVFVTGSAYDSTTGIDYANRCLPRLPALPGSASPRQSARPGKRTLEWPSGGPGQPDPGAIREPGDPGLLAGGNASRQSATRCTGECIKASDSLAGHDPHIEYVECGWRATGRSEIISQRNAAQLRGTSAFRCEHGDGHSSPVTLLTGTPWGD